MRERAPTQGRIWDCIRFSITDPSWWQRPGGLIADFLNLRLRETTALTIDRFTLDLHVRSNTLASARKWYDNVVAATSYIGPLNGGPPPASPTGLRVVP